MTREEPAEAEVVLLGSTQGGDGEDQYQIERMADELEGGGSWSGIENGAVTSAVLVHLRVEPAHFDWRWRERPALTLLAWEALARDPLAGYAAFKWSQSQRQLILGRRAITNRRYASCAL